MHFINLIHLYILKGDFTKRTYTLYRDNVPACMLKLIISMLLNSLMICGVVYKNYNCLWGCVFVGMYVFLVYKISLMNIIFFSPCNTLTDESFEVSNPSHSMQKVWYEADIRNGIRNRFDKSFDP